MFDNTADRNRDRDAAEQLDRIWDDVHRSGLDGEPARSGDEAAASSFIAYLDLLAPSLDGAARERMRQQLFTPQQEESMTAPIAPITRLDARALAAPLSLPSPRPAKPSRWRHVQHPIVQIAATLLLILAFIGTWLMVRTGDGPNRSTPQFAAGSPSPDTALPSGGGQGNGVITLEIDRYGEDHILYATIRRITLEPGALWDFDTGAFALESNLVGHYLESGSVTVGGPDDEIAITAGDGFTFNGANDTTGFLNYIQNNGSEASVIIEMIVHNEGVQLPEPPMGSTIESIAMVPFLQPANAISRVRLVRTTMSGDGSPAYGVGPKQQIAFVAVESGAMLVQTERASIRSIGQLDTSSPIPGPPFTEQVTLYPGESITTVPGQSLANSLSVQSDEPLTTLSLSIEHLSPEDVAQERQYSETALLEIPANSGQVSMILREVTIEPGAEWRYDFSGVSQFYDLSGEALLFLDATGPPEPLETGRFVARAVDGQIAMENGGPEPATFIQAVVYAGGDLDAAAAWGGTLPDGVTVRLLGVGATPMPSGQAEIMLFTDSAPAEGSSSQYVAASAHLGSIIEGEVTISRLGGTITIERAVPASADADGVMLEPDSAIGQPIVLETGDAFFVHPGSGFGTAGSGGIDNRMIVLVVAPAGPGEAGASPVASPQAESATGAGELIEVAPDDCTIEARSIDDFEAILNAPYAEGTPDAGLRDEAATGTPADQATIDGVTETVKQIVACNAPGSHLEMYSLYSANMLRYQAVFGNLTIDDIDGLDQIDASESSSPLSGYIAVEDVVIFPDGRAGAMVNANGETAYLTFIFDDGRWLIDFWDDRDLNATPVP